MVHQVAVRMPLEAMVEKCSNLWAVARFKKDVEQLPFPIVESSAVDMDVDAGIGPCLENDKLPPSANGV